MIMSEQYLQYIRECFMMATADTSGKTKGQLQAFTESTQVCTTRLKRKRRTIVEEDGKRITIHSAPVPGTETRPSSGAIALIDPATFSATSWRRAIYPIASNQRSWLSWCYTGDISFSHQEEITRWAWGEFRARIEVMGKRIAGKTIEKLRALTWLAAQDVKARIMGGKAYQCQEVAELLQVSAPNWSKNYGQYWSLLCGIFQRLDREGLISLSRSRSQQKATFSQQGIAKVN